MSLKRLVQLPRMPALQPVPVMVCVFNELTEAFRDHGFRIVTIRDSIDEMEDGGLIFLDDAAGRYLNKLDLYHAMASKCPNSVFICWYWMSDIRPFKYMIHTGENHTNLSALCPQRQKYLALPTFVPLLLRANDHPSLIGTYPRNVVRDYCYMGSGKKVGWIPSKFSGIYHLVGRSGFMPYDERRQVYLSSMFAFAFQAGENIRTGHLSQRIFEGLAYGCITLCENKLAADFTDGAVIYVSSPADLRAKMTYYLNNPELVIAQQQKGYEWVRQYGTNRLSIKHYLDKIGELYDLSLLDESY